MAAQARYNSAEAVAARQAAATAAAAEESIAAVHEENEWAIEVVPDGSSSVEHAETGVSAAQSDGLAEGIQYSMPVRTS